MSQRGFTLIECLAAIAVMTIVLTIGLPSMAKLIQQHRTQTTAYELYQALQLTRLEAVRRNDRATARPLGDSWQDGWEVFADPEHSARRRDDIEPLIRSHPRTEVIVHANRPLQNHVSYIGTGESRRSGGGVRHRGAFQAGTFTVCPAEPGRGYQLVLARGGRVRMARVGEATCEKFRE